MLRLIFRRGFFPVGLTNNLNNMFYRNDIGALNRLREDILTNGRKLRWHEYAVKYNICNSEGVISGETARGFIKSAFRDGRCPELDKAKMAGHAIPKGIREWDTFYGNKRYTVDYKIDGKEDRWKKLFDGLSRKSTRLNSSH